MYRSRFGATSAPIPPTAFTWRWIEYELDVSASSFPAAPARQRLGGGGGGGGGGGRLIGSGIGRGFVDFPTPAC